jgi:hypothetical protein
MLYNIKTKIHRDYTTLYSVKYGENMF